MQCITNECTQRAALNLPLTLIVCIYIDWPLHGQARKSNSIRVYHTLHVGKRKHTHTHTHINKHKAAARVRVIRSLQTRVFIYSHQQISKIYSRPMRTFSIGLFWCLLPAPSLSSFSPSTSHVFPLHTTVWPYQQDQKVNHSVKTLPSLNERHSSLAAAHANAELDLRLEKRREEKRREEKRREEKRREEKRREEFQQGERQCRWRGDHHNPCSHF